MKNEAGISRIGILTSGGDCPGLNAAIRAATRHARQHYGWTVFGIRRATAGLMERPVDAEPLDERAESAAFLTQGGTLLGTISGGNPFAHVSRDGHVVDRSHEAAEGIRQLGLDALIAIGGDGSLRILRRLCQREGLPLVVIPKTIDNDIGGVDQSIGFASALETATQALDRIQTVAQSHDRIMVVEVMGRDSGKLALAAGIAGGADAILVPEVPSDLKHLATCLRDQSTRSGRHAALVVVAEGVRREDGTPSTIREADGAERYGGIGDYVAQRLHRLLGSETRAVTLGHTLRGGTPSAGDRLMASVLGVAAIDAAAAGRFDLLVTWRAGAVHEVQFADSIATEAGIRPGDALLRAARRLGICLGDAPA